LPFGFLVSSVIERLLCGDARSDKDYGETIWQVAKRQGREIPHLCYSPAPDYRPDGNCRVCMVEVEGERVLAASCKRTPSVGMKVKSASARVVAIRRYRHGDHRLFALLDREHPPLGYARAHNPEIRCVACCTSD
jgi:hypothetical protein